jgi:NADH-quinone oxidoreductase subunit G
MEVTSYLEGALTSELRRQRGRPVPVGALVSRPIGSKARPWELRKVPAIDVMDAVGTNIPPRCPHARGDARLAADQRGRERGMGDDKTRHAVDGLLRAARPAVDPH